MNIDKEMRDEYFDGFIRSGVRRKYVNHGLLKFVARTPQETYTYRSVQPNLSELDHLKEEVGYLKFWQGITVVTDISIAGWLISSSGTAAPYTISLAVIGLIVFTAGIVFLHRRIERRMTRIKEL